jgi:transposase
MSNKIFTDAEIGVLSKNQYVKNVSAKGITYTDEFKRIFIDENEKGKLPRDIFTAYGFVIDILGMDRVRSSGNRWRSVLKRMVYVDYKIQES